MSVHHTTLEMKATNTFRNARYMQYLAAITATMSIACITMYSTWSSPSLPKLTSPDSPIGTTLSEEEASWVASSYLLGIPPGSLFAGLFVEKFGRRTALLTCTIPIFVPWIVLALASSIWALIIPRFVAGLGTSLAMTAVPMYIGEIAEKDIRGKLGTIVNILKLSGSLYVLSVGPFVSYAALTWSCSAFPLVFASLFFFMPESPYFYVKRGDMDTAKAIVIRLSHKKVDQKSICSRMDDIAKTVEHDIKNQSTLWELFSKREYRKSLIIMFGIKTLQQFSGPNAIESYMQTIIEASSSSITPEQTSIICGVIQIPAVLVASVLVDKMGRKPLLIISSLGCAVALIAEGTYFYLQNVLKADVSSISWLPTTGLMLFLVMNSIGIFTLPYVLFGEIFATNIKGVALSVATFYSGVLAFLVVKFFGPISFAWGMYTMFWIFAGVCIWGALFVFFVIPETKGKTFSEIQQKLNRRKACEGSA